MIIDGWRDDSDNMDDMLKLPGVGRKTANLILGDIFGIPGIVVDTYANGYK